MGIFSRLLGRSDAVDRRPRAAVQSSGGGTLLTTSDQLEAALRSGDLSAAGIAVNPDQAMRVATVYACIRIIAGAVATLPLHLKRRTDERTRVDADDDPLWRVLRRRPNAWQTPSQFRRMMQSHLLLRGSAYALKSGTASRVTGLVPLDPDRMRVEQLDDLSLRYTYTRRNGVKVGLSQAEVFHLVGMSLDGVHGCSPIRYAREAIGLALSMEGHGAAVFRNGARTAGVLSHPHQLGKEGLENLRTSLDAYREGGDNEGKWLILEEGMEPKQTSMTAVDAQWIESRKFSRTDIAMFFGVPPHMIGDTEKATSWGSGIEQQSIGFVAYTLEDHLTTWEEAINRDLVGSSDVYARFNRAALVKGDLKTRVEAYGKFLQWGVYSPNEIRALEDANPREGGDDFYDPPNTAGSTSGAQTGDGDEPS